MKNARWMRYKPLRKLVLTAAILFLTGAAFAAGVPRVNKSMPYAKGLNLSEWLEVGGFGNVRKCIYGKQDFENIKKLGVEIIRVPIWFEEFSSGKPDYIVEDWLWETIDNAIEWCEELQMYMIIDFHNNCDEIQKRVQM